MQSRHQLEAFQWDVALAAEDHFSRHQDSENDPDYVEEEEEPAAVTGGRKLGDGSASSRPIPVAASSSEPTKQPATQKKFATLGDFSSAAAKEDPDSDDENHDLFAGGEKSGLAVQNPDDLKKRILEKAQKQGAPRAKEPVVKKSHFAGAARTLGGDDAPSREIPAAPQPRQTTQRVDRTLHFWRNGFSVDDGDLYRADDPRNAEILNLIRQGRAPLHIMNVEPGQEVDVEIKQHEEDFVKPKAVYKPFGGQGNRLGSPTPGAASSTMPGSFTAGPPATTAPAAPPTAEVDDSKPTLTIRISLGTGTRLTSRFNTDATIGDVYAFVERAESSGRRFVLQTTFPTNELTDKSKVLSEMPEFKRGGAIVQKYV